MSKAPSQLMVWPVVDHSICCPLFWFGLLLYVPVNIYGHVKTTSSPNHTFFLDKLEQAVNQYFVHIISLVTDSNPS